MTAENEPVQRCWTCDRLLSECTCPEEGYPQIPVTVPDSKAIFERGSGEWMKNGVIPLCGTRNDQDPKAYPDS